MTKAIKILILFLLCHPICSWAQQNEEKSKIHFAPNSCFVDIDLSDNRAELERISHLFDLSKSDPNITITKISINSYASPEGGRRYNDIIAKKRTDAICNYLAETTLVPEGIIVKKHSGSDWDGLYRLIEESDMTYRNEALDIIKNVPEETWRRVNPSDRWLTLVDSRLKHLKDLGYGEPYRFIYTNYFPLLRVGSVVTVFYEVAVEPPTTETLEAEAADTIKAVEVATEPAETPEETLADTTANVTTKEKKPIKFALKTNLLYDVLISPNIEVEIPIGKRWSVAAEWIFPWWTFDNGTSESCRSRLQILNGNIEGKYWLGNRDTHDQLTGWYCGIYSGGGLYDIEYKAEGYQGEFFIAAGVSGGYAHTINKSGSLRFEYSLGLGYMATNYRHYNAIWGNDDKWHPVRKESGTYTWVGPTKVKVSLVWMLGQKAKKGGGVWSR